MTDPIDTSLIAHTEHGRVRGSREGAVTVFRGIPYAAPPVGPLRFRPPQPPEPWDGVRDALEWGPVSAQVADPIERYDSEPELLDSVAIGTAIPVFADEDSLYLNVWTPAVDGAARPVMVYLHGGAFVVGSASSSYYTGRHLAGHDVVVVTCNYRLGVFGFLELGEIDGSYRGSGNNGLRDQIAALRWVRRNIAAFGGDPSNVTVFGESAGSISICALLATADPRALFDRAIAQSGGPNLVHTASVQARAAVDVLTAVTQLGIDDIFTAAASRLVEAGHLAMLTSPLADTLYAPYVDGDLVTGDPYELLRRGHAAGIGLMAGATQDEMNYWAMYDAELRNPFVEHTDAGAPVGLPRHVRSALDASLAPSTLDGIYTDWVARHDPPRGRRDDATTVLLAQVDDHLMIQPMTHLVEAHLPHAPCYLYRFAWKVPSHLLESRAHDLGAIHALELSFVFGNRDIIAPGGPRVWEDDGQRTHADTLSLQMQQAWTNFARCGDPNGGEAPHWPPYDLDARPTMRWGNDPRGALDVRSVDDPDGDRRRAWASHTFAPFG